MAKPLPTFERVVIEVSGGCNYSCRMCPQSSPGRPQGFLRKMDIKTFTSVLEQCAPIRVINLEGSGEPTLLRDLPYYIRVAKRYADRVQMFTNGYRFEGSYMMECFDAGLDYARFSVIGYDPISYRKWMQLDGFDRVYENAEAALTYASSRGAHVASYHLILDPAQEQAELQKYRDNWIDPLGIDAEVWRQHNWSGVYPTSQERRGPRKTCGRPFSPDLVVRAGGVGGKHAAVHPCCQVLGRDEEAVLGHLSHESVSDVWWGRAYAKLREQHETGDYPSFCRDCDFLIDDPEVLVWTNYDRSLSHMHGTLFSLDEYR